ncbi:hypothetical protein ACI2IX_04615 [Leifsonia aquatica]|uniref:hypothetical protein n=1 Tax=Leifsonia aquatica TaxID=144185 RepID=UPI00384E48B8
MTNPSGQQPNPDPVAPYAHETVRDFLHSMGDVFRSESSEELGAHFTTDATVVVDGEAFYGRAEIVAVVQALQPRWASTTIRSHAIGADTAAALVVFRTADAGASPSGLALLTLVA